MNSLIFYSKLILKNPILYIVVALNFYYFYFLNSTLLVSAVEFVTYTYYLNIGINLAALFFGYYFAVNKKWIHLFYERDLLKKGMQLTTVLILMTVGLIAMNILYIFIFGQKLLLNGSLYLIIVFLLNNLLAIIIGVSFGLLLSKLWGIVFPIAFYSIFIFFSTMINLPQNQFLNIYVDQLTYQRNNLLGIQFNEEFWLDKLFLIGLIGILILITVTILSNNKVVRAIAITSILVSISLNFTLIKRSDFIEQKNSYEVSDLKAFRYKIKNYSMKIKLRNVLENNVTIYLKADKVTKHLKFNLDKHFIINSVMVDHVTRPYHFKEGELTIEHALQVNEEVNVEIQYAGNISLENMNYPVVYVTPGAVSLPGFQFNWYPQTKQKEAINFDVYVNSKQSMFSTLPKKKEFNHFKGRSVSASFFASTLYKYQKVKAKKYVIPDYYQIKYTLPDFKNEVSLLHSSHLTNKNKQRLIEEDFNQVIVIPAGLLEDSFKLIDDTLLLSLSE